MKVKGKGMFSYSAVSCPLDNSKRFTLHPPGRPDRSDTQLDFSEKHSDALQLLHKDYSLTFPPLSMARHSLIQLSQLGRGGENGNAQAAKQPQRVLESGILSPSYHAPHNGIPNAILMSRIDYIHVYTHHTFLGPYA